MTPEMLDRFTTAEDPQLSPDGRFVAYVVSRVDLGANAYCSQIWVVGTEPGANPRPLSAGKHRDRQPRWSPDGSTVAFTSTRSSNEQGGKESTLHLLPFRTPGETILVTTSAESMSSPAFSPNGRWLAFAMRTRSTDYTVTDPAKREPRKIENMLFMLNGEGFICDRPSHIYAAALDGSGEVRNLTEGQHECSNPAWFPNSDRLAFELNPLLTQGTSYIATVTLDGEVTTHTAQTSMMHSPAVSPDGSQVALVGSDDVETFFENMHIGLVNPDVEGTAPSWISTSLDRTWQPMMASSPTWTEHGLLAAVADRGNVHLYEIDTAGGEPSRLLGGDRTITGWSTGSIDGEHALVFSATDRTTPSELYLSVGGTERALTSVSAPWTTTTAPVDGEHFLAPTTAEGADGVDAWIYRPKDFDPSKKYPLLLNIHGGPFSQYGNFYFDEFQLQAQAGYVVVCSNPRGGSGRDTAWGNAVRGPKHKNPGTGWGSVDADDVLSVLDESLRRFDFIDPDRLGVLGGSYGGYLTTWLISHCDRFAAACSERAANNLLSLEFGSDFAGFFNAELGPRHFDDPAEYLRMSPVSYIRDINTPLLIVHSEEDLRCPVEQATQLFVSMKVLEKDVEYWLFPSESHELTRSGSPIHRKRRAEIILEYFDRKLLDQQI